MNQYLKQRIFSFALGAALLLGLAACDSTSTNSDVSDDELSLLSASLSEELSLSTAQSEDVSGSFSKHGGHGKREPGFLWQVAGDLQSTLTDEQKAELFDRTEQMEGVLSFRGLLGFPGAGGFYGIGGFMGGSRRHGVSPVDAVLNLTEEQETALHELHDTYREQFKALAESFKTGEITEDDMVAEIVALRDEKKAAVLEVLTDEQKAALEAFRAEREAEFAAFREEVNAVRNEVLSLTDDQASAMDALFEEQLAARENLIEQLQAGEITAADFQAEIEALETARREVLEGLLDAVQLEIVQIHDALAVRSGRFGHRGHRGGFGRGNGHGHTFGG